VQFSTYANLSLEQEEYSEMIKDVERVFILLEGSYSIDQQRYNFFSLEELVL
jgi:predicted Zn-dependent protease